MSLGRNGVVNSTPFLLTINNLNQFYMKTIKARPMLIKGNTDNKLKIFKEFDGAISYSGFPSNSSSKEIQLILISLEDEKIEEEMQYLDILNKEIIVMDKSTANMLNARMLYNPHYKVIATQSQLSPQYISKFVEEYNGGCVKDLEIEMDVRSNAALGYKEYVYLKHIVNKKYIPVKIDANIYQETYSLGKEEEFEDWEIEIYSKLTPEGYITIVEKEPIMYSEEEVSKLFNEFAKKLSYEFMMERLKGLDAVNFSINWLETNKKIKS